MKTEQEQIEEMIKIFTDNREVCQHMRCVECKYHGDVECMYSSCANSLYQAGYGDVSEYKAEIEQLKSEYEQLETNAEILARGVRDLNHENWELTEKVKQAQIDVLNKVKKRIYDISPYNPIVTKDNVKCFIDELIKEVQNAEDKG